MNPPVKPSWHEVVWTDPRTGERRVRWTKRTDAREAAKRVAARGRDAEIWAVYRRANGEPMSECVETFPARGRW